MFVFKAAVVGGGKTGGEIAHAIAAAGIPVVLDDPDRGRVEHGIATARSLVQKQVDSGKLDQAGAERVTGLITPSTGYEGFGEVDFVIETMADRLDLKQAVFAELDGLTPGHAILAANTALLSITEIAETTVRPEKVVGFHLTAPISATRAVEVIEGEYTSPETAQVAAGFAQTIRRMPIRCGDGVGFVAGRLLLSCLSEVWLAQEETGATIEEIDQIVAAAKVIPMGPYRLADTIGLDAVLRLAEHLRETYGDRFHVPARLADLVDDGHLGASTGRGFHVEA